MPLASRRETQLTWLLQAVLNRTTAPLTYAAGHTGTAAEVFASGTANCLGFTQLYVAIAREVGLPVYFFGSGTSRISRRTATGHRRRSTLRPRAAPPDQRRMLDFAQRPVTAYRWVEPISDLTAVALYYSNRGAEELRDGRTDSGLELLRIAMRFDPELADAWINLGVAERRTGDLVAAESSYRRALEVDSSHCYRVSEPLGSARLIGREQEAEELLGFVDQAGNRNPFSYVALGDLSLRPVGSRRLGASTAAPCGSIRRKPSRWRRRGVGTRCRQASRGARQLLKKAERSGSREPPGRRAGPPPSG